MKVLGYAALLSESLLSVLLIIITFQKIITTWDKKEKEIISHFPLVRSHTLTKETMFYGNTSIVSSKNNCMIIVNSYLDYLKSKYYVLP